MLFDNYIRSILDEYRPKTILEIGVLYGATTIKLLKWCSGTGAQLTSLDPVRWEGDLPEEIKQAVPGYKYKRGQEQFENVTIVPHYLEEVYREGLQSNWTCLKMRSLDYLSSATFAGVDLYLIDGDHNYYTVSNELCLIHGKTRAQHVVLLNDVVGWCTRHDQYYDPTFIPAEHVGGHKQGVLTAVEDFLDSLSQRRLWWRVNCPYRFKILTRKHDGLAILEGVGDVATDSGGRLAEPPAAEEAGGKY